MWPKRQVRVVSILSLDLVAVWLNPSRTAQQWANNKLLTDLSDKKEVFGCLRRDLYVTVLFKQMSNTVPGEFLGRLVLGVEDEEVKVFGATIF